MTGLLHVIPPPTLSDPPKPPPTHTHILLRPPPPHTCTFLRSHVHSSGHTPLHISLRSSPHTISSGPPPRLKVAVCIPTLAKLMYSEDTETLAHACWAASFLADGPNDKIQRIVDGGLCGRLVELLMFPDKQVITPALRAVGNVLTGDDIQTQVCMCARACVRACVCACVRACVCATFHTVDCDIHIDLLSGIANRMMHITCTDTPPPYSSFLPSLSPSLHPPYPSLPPSLPSGGAQLLCAASPAAPTRQPA